jgi:iron complex outermembrane recepter protein
MKKTFSIFVFAQTKVYATFLKIGLLLYFWALMMPVFAQNFTVSGKVTDKNKKPIAGTNITLKTSQKGTVSNEEGNYSFSVPSGKDTLIFSCVGFLTKKIPLNSKQNSTLDVILEEDLTAIICYDVTYLEELNIFSNRLHPITQQQLTQADIRKNNLGQDLPFLLNFTPSMVATSDAGAGVGYTAMRIRGSDASRINVTINGIAYNDSESQGTFLVNMPDLASSVGGIQIQRGVGSSTNGAGAFGASVHIQTASNSATPYAQINNSFGSFGTGKHTVMFGTGKIKDRFSIDGRLSKIYSNGFIDRAFSDLKSFYLSGNYNDGKNNLTFNIISGQERTYQAWNGVPEEELLKGNRTYNELTYENEIDNYQQDHYQLLYKRNISSRLEFNGALHYTKGAGYYEQYKTDQKFADYGLEDLKIASETITKTDLIRRRWLDNDFYGFTYNFLYKSGKYLGAAPVLDIHLGGAWNTYKGRHFGEVIWAKMMSNGQIRHRYYDNDAQKTDFNSFLKVNYQFLEGLFGFVDLQVRRVDYSFLGYGYDKNQVIQNVQQSANLTFFNPKMGIRWQKNQHDFYASYSIGNREPNRDDYTQSTPESRPKAETLHNWEVGYGVDLGTLDLAINYYLMSYENQLVLTGKLNDVGAYIRTNIPDSYRTGVELSGRWTPSEKWQIEGNLTLSRNKIKQFTEYLDDYDAGDQKTVVYDNTDIAFSPNMIAGGEVSFTPIRNLKFSLLNKYVGNQFLDNTSSESRKLKAYYLNDLRFTYSTSWEWLRNLEFNVLLNNIFDVKYESNGYSYGYIAGGATVRANYYYPQAGRNFMIGMNLGF